MKLSRYLLSSALVVVLAACGGGGGSSATTAGNGNGTTTPIPIEAILVSSFVYQLEKNAITNSGTDATLLTVTALDAKNNPVEGATLQVAVDSGIYTPNSTVTNTTGQVSGKVSIGGNKSNRDIQSTLTMNGKSQVVAIPVTGSQLTLTPVPASPSLGVPMTLTIKVTDVNGAGIANASVKLGGTLGFTQSFITNTNGNVEVKIEAVPSTVGTYTIVATASGVTETRDVVVVDASGGGIKDAIATISSVSLALVPNTIAPNTTGSETNRAGLRAVFLNSTNQAIQNVRVRFVIMPPRLGSDEKISTGTATVYSDISGVAVADYIAGTRSSPTNGVIIRACYGNTDAEIANNACPRFKEATMTVASQPLSITMGDNNELVKGDNNLTYIKKFDIAVADAAGNAVPNAQLSASVDLKKYEKGAYAGPRFSCENEDANRNGSLDSAEKAAGDGDDIISPRKADVILSFVGAAATGSNGRATIQVEYPQNVATWLVYAVKVTTSVAGSEGTVEKSYVTSFVNGDDFNGSFLKVPYGANDCKTPN